MICCGSGGVGKTTAAAVIAMSAARAGRRAVVVTIDPARRLADALGLEGLTNTPSRIEGVTSPDGSGEMWAMMLDTKATFDGLVQRYSADPDQAERILDNAFYQNISGSLSGTQEYMASEKLYELAVEGDFDLVVVDTPPTRNALDFIDAPQRLAHFLSHPLYRVFMTPTRGIVKAVNVAAQALTRSIAKVVGAEVIGDAIAFFAAFEGMEEGFAERANHVEQLLGEQSTAFVLVASPEGRHRGRGELLRRSPARARHRRAGPGGQPDAARPSPGAAGGEAGPGDGRRGDPCPRRSRWSGTDLGDLYTLPRRCPGAGPRRGGPPVGPRRTGRRRTGGPGPGAALRGHRPALAGRASATVLFATPSDD